MNYEETLQYFNNAPKFSQILGNTELLRLLDKLGNPQNHLRFIHVAGTNGKGSVCAMLAEILTKSGLKTGLFTSPFIEIFNERIRVNGTCIPNEVLARISTAVKNAIDELGIEISVFARITAVAFLYFKECECDIVVLETGLGGRLDATNVIAPPSACVITKIGLDHTEYLGNTLAEIASEKCGIIKSGTYVITPAEQPTEALEVIKSECAKKSVPLYIADEYCGEISLHGDFQKSNAGVACKTAEILNIDSASIAYGIAHTHWAARFEFLRPDLILDGAHNPDGISALVKSLKSLGKPIIFVTAMMRDKAWENSARILNSCARAVIATEIPIPRCLPATELATAFDVCKAEPDCIAAIKIALDMAHPDDIVCICGSLYLAGEVRKMSKCFTL